MSWPFRQARFDYGPRTGPILGFLIHMAEGGNTVGYLAGSPDRGVSVHYVVEYSGRVVQMLLETHASGSVNPQMLRTDDDATGPFGITAARAVLGSWARDPNAVVISVELEGFARDGPNDQQIIGLQALVVDVRHRHPAIGLLGHRDFQSYKPCPGRLIPWALIGGHGSEMANHTRETTVLPWGGTYTIEAGARPTALKLDRNGVVTERRQWGGSDTSSTAHFDAWVVDDGTTGNPFMRCTDGYFSGFLLSSGQVTGHANPAPPPAPADCEALKGRIESAVIAAIEATT